MLITSVNNEKIKELVKYKNKSARDATNKFLVEGIHLVEEAIKEDLVIEVYLLEDSNLSYKYPTTYISKNVMEKLSMLESISPVIALCHKKENSVIGSRVLALDNIQDPGNLGTMIRSACAFNFDTILLSSDSVDLYNPKVIRSTKGMIFHTNVITCNLEDKLLNLKNNNYDILTTNVNNGIDIKTYQPSDKLALIIGNEGHGVRDSIAKLSNYNIYIKMSNKCESLNAAVAASILMYEVNK